MIRIIKNTILALSTGAILTSCYTVSTLETDVLNPATYEFSQDIYRIGVISRMELDPVVKDPTLTNSQRNEISQQRKILNNGVIGLLDGLAESPRFEAYQVKPMFQLNKEESPLNIPIKWARIASLARKDTLDFIISLTAVNYKDTVTRPLDLLPEDEEKQNSFAKDQEVDPRSLKYRSYILFPHLYWRLYDLNNETYTIHVQIDTLIFDPGPEKGYPSSDQRLILFHDVVGYQAYEYSQSLAPYWTTEYRAWYILGDDQFVKAGELAEKGDWLAASEIWKKLSQSSSRPLAARASFNMALASEMMDQFDVALEWVERSKKLGLSYYPDHYKDVLIDRIVDMVILDKQMK